MKKIIIISICFSILSCSPFISKELRQKNRCNRKLERAIKKCPELLKTDTVEKIIEVEVPKIEIKDSIVLKVEIDSVTVDSLLKHINTLKTQKERTKTLKEYVLKSFSLDTTITDTLYSLSFKINNGVFSHDIVINEQKIKKEIQIEQQTVQEVKLSLFEQLLTYLGSWIWLAIILFVIWILFRLFKKFMLWKN